MRSVVLANVLEHPLGAAAEGSPMSINQKWALKDVISSTIVIAHKEDTSNLERFFAVNSASHEIQIFDYSPDQIDYPSIVKCFINHRLAWEKASKRDAWTLIVEADFVPIKDLFEQPVFWPHQDANSYGYLYHNSPRIISFAGEYIRAHSAGCVAYVINRHVAKILLEFYDDEKEKRDFTKYFTFDVHLQWYCMGRGVKAYISEKQLGEHGGFVSPGHVDNKIPRFGRHRADRLAGDLAFEPLYTKGSNAVFVRERLYGYSIGLARLVAGRWTTDTGEHRWTLRERLAAYSLVTKRLFF